MTETEKKALALAEQWEPRFVTPHRPSRKDALVEIFTEHLRAIEQHETFRQEVSDAAVEYNECGAQSGWLGFDRFIIAKPDPLLEAWMDAFSGTHIDDARDECAKINAALAARGLEVRKIGEKAGE